MSHSFLQQITKAAVISAVVIPSLIAPAVAQGSVPATLDRLEEMDATTVGSESISSESSLWWCVFGISHGNKDKDIGYGCLF